MSVADAIVLGTAQFGLAYGVANESGKPDGEQVAETIRVARNGGIRTLDTAIAYGESEARLGTLDLAGMQVMTKLPSVPDDCVDVRAWVREQVRGSLARLRIDRLHALSFHRPDQLLGARGGELYAAVRLLKDEALVEKIGISIYQPDELEPLFAEHEFDLVQAPFSLFDRRLLDTGWPERLRAMHCELHVRSIFLQGLLLMPGAERPRYFHRWQSLLEAWDAWLVETGLSPLQVCLRYALSVPGIAKVVLGVDGPGQLEEILAAAAGPLPTVPAQLRSIDPDLLNPSRWPQS